MRVTLVTETYAPQLNGVSRTLGHLVRVLRAAGDAVQVVTPEYTAGARVEPPDVAVPSCNPPFYPELYVPLPPFGRVITAIERYGALDDAVSPDVKASDAPQGICYPRDPSVLFWPWAISYEEQAPQLTGWEWVIRARSRVGGVDVRRAAHMLYIENFD